VHSLSADREAEIAESELEAEDWRRQRAETDLARAQDLLVFVEELARRLSALEPDQPAAAFIRSFREVVRDYVRPGVRHLDAVVDEIDQLGTVGAIGGSFSLESFTRAFAANLEAATTRETSLGAGIFVGDYRLAAGMSFRHVVLSGAFEGALPAGPGTEPLMEDAVWAELRRAHPFIEDAALRVERARQAASRATAAAGDGTVVWTAPLYQPGGTREYYPAPPMVSDAARADPRIRTATDLRLARSLPGLRRGDSPLAMMLSGAAADSFEASLRDAVEKKQHGLALGPGHALQPSLRLLRARRGRYFSEYDGNLAALVSTGGFGLERRLSPTTLEDYGACGFRYLCRSVLRLNVVEEPEERETMEPAARGLLVHRVLERFFVEESEKGRPKAREPWTAADADRLLEIADEELDRARARGQTGLDIYVEHEARSVRADLVAFLEHDSVFRAETGGVPSEFEVRTPEIEVAGLRLRGRADRIDRTPDGRRAWVIDYKTGSKKSYSDMERDPLKGGTRLQLPVYMAAAGDAEELRALYWFVSRKGEFERAEFVATREHMERYGRTLHAIAQSIGRGIFAAVPGEENLQFSSFENCRYCDFDRICSRRRDAELVDKSSDPALAYWFAIGEAASP
jgi:ATP-dependent helicase/nuclease subunit B